MPRLALLLFVVVLMTPAMGSAADVAAGQAQFNKCKICHTLDAGGKNGVGPNLHGILGRKAGSLDGFNYSDAMKESGIVWNDAVLEKYIKNPREVLPGGKMAFPGIKDDDQIADLVAYLHQATQ